MEFQDKVLKCIDCGADFVFTAGEQLFFHDKQFKNEPKRCKPCKTKRASSLGTTSAGGYSKVETRTNCSGSAKKLPSRSNPHKVDLSFVGSAFSSAGVRLPLPDPHQSMSASSEFGTAMLEVCVACRMPTDLQSIDASSDCLLRGCP